MRFFTAAICILFSCSLSFGYIQTKDDYGTEIKILKELDIDPSYVQDQYFLGMQDDQSNASKKHLLKAINESYRQVSILKDILGDAEFPKSVLYLAVIESGLSNHVTSGSKAAGIWQLMPNTARVLGLRVDKFVDERKDPIASTKAAVKYLTKLKNRFGKWYLALIAYNCGDGKLEKAISAAKSDKLGVLLNPNKKYLSLETRNFMRKILLTAKSAEDLNFVISNGSSVFNNPGEINITKVSVPSATPLSAVASAIGISTAKIKELNPHLIQGATPPNSPKFGVYIPKNKQDLFASNFKPGQKAEFTSKSSKIAQSSNYKVKKGDTLISISHKFDVKISELRAANKLKSSNLSVGDNIVIPE